MCAHIDLCVIGIYLAFLVVVGLTFSRLVRNSSDYFRAGAQGSWWMMGTSMFVSGISAYTFVGNAAGIFKSGWTPMVIYLANVGGFLGAALLLGPWYRQMRAITYAEVIRERFGKSAEQLVSHLLVINNLVWAGAGLYTLATFLRPLTPGWSEAAIIVAVGSAVVIYSSIGGSWASAANDFAQSLVLISVTITITVLCFQRTGGIGGFFAAVHQSPAAGDLSFIKTAPANQSDWTSGYGLTWMAVTFVFQIFNQSSLFQGVRYFSAKDGREARKAAWLACVLMSIGLVVFFVPPIFARVFLEPQVLAMHPLPEKAAEYAYAVASREVLPKGASALLSVVIFAAAIGTLDTSLNRTAGLVVRNLLPAHRKLLGMSPAQAGNEMVVGRIATIGIGMMVMGFAMIYTRIEGSSIFDVMQRIIAQLIGPQIIPLMLFLFVRKVPRWAIFSSLAGGYLPSLVVWVLMITRGTHVSYPQVGTMVFTGGVAGFLVSRLFWKRVPEEERRQTAAFYERMKRPVDFGAEVGEGSDLIQFRMVGRSSLVLAALFLLLLIPMGDGTARAIVLAISGSIGGIGGVLLWCGRVASKRKISR
ncbi:hypothetical protein KBB96_03335 [Luteolibacter ambystomatis]|uniref:Uncharacterized protein n=1 Tax=Luteolibacter ambystomatis TaxID=2824561 RepID=A0A975J0T0_9BACT|nr:hypothetical protein [Luteolibacter ambystomatis]QUE51928.1 hypothetical protein KBB96_03335 [Luteolibacter ambystomatis]